MARAFTQREEGRPEPCLSIVLYDIPRIHS
ncbi:predicted protein [Sclerotinia sclerotiorum 1980 UF-70]|uniref:Uncharacterized protein n=1 Tax=Sclerotinia sclerotiorum (strain ATCC 18683 / 1980 / Ss-1) TaxID=665079 RepID=A7F0M2_SCLS1|nr:predicted protein [Sclerotinia sclerotiorum 1980 UF-70]EDN95264.1 predicted protein [Sclerotinia sclerotiorum 1980 UF-70]